VLPIKWQHPSSAALFHHRNPLLDRRTAAPKTAPLSPSAIHGGWPRSSSPLLDWLMT
jgi:hypothetical protein